MQHAGKRQAAGCEKPWLTVVGIMLQFGEIDIDSELVTARDTLADGEQQIMMLNNGCLCCTVRDDLVKMLAELVRPATPSFSTSCPCCLDL